MSLRGRVKTHPAPERSAFLSVPRGWIWQSRAGSVSQRAFAPDGRGSTSTLRYMDAAVRRDEGRLCFINRKSKNLVSNDRRFFEKNISFFLRIRRERIKTCGLSFETSLLFSSSSPLFWKRRPPLRPRCHPLFSHPQLRTRERTRPCASRTQRVRISCLHPSPSPASR